MEWLKKNISIGPKSLKIFYFIITLKYLVLSSQAQAVSKTGTSAAQFLKIGVGPRATALAGSFAGMADDASSLFWNPAGAAWLPERQFMASHTEWFADIDHEFLGLIIPFSRSGSFGISFLALTAPEMEQTTIKEPEGSGIFFNVQDIAIGLTYSRKMTDRFSFGLTFKYVQQSLFNETASTIATDFGGLLHTGFKGMRIGITLNNFGGKLQLEGRDLIVSYDADQMQGGNPLIPAVLETQSWPLPTNFRIGLAMDIIGLKEGLVLRESQRLTFLVDGYNVNDAQETMSFGLEYTWNEHFFLRGGYRLNHDLESFSSGVGIQLPIQKWMIKTDYAVTNMGDLGYIQRIALGIRF